MEEVFVHPRVMKRHSELSEQDVLSAWRNMFTTAIRYTPDGERLVAVGSDPNGRLIEMVAVQHEDKILAFHAMTPPSKKTLVELKLQGR